ncbi:Aste57867_19472 [Aphanomyces stellatus]|uniref:Aste57867_19472 protein n=1 Tax=Aphanomyces stellatus TaxID=120398 RepID=A0A485LCT7_9STRA|nr:hypothetical protein As57867_019408 [Aphanomyces stellatus]VFT96183.1 Aste57867_19472 [Aphanomyces stellatus]
MYLARPEVHKIQKNTDGSVHITDMTSDTIANENRAMKLLERTNKNRTVSATKLNEKSSRSHCITTLRLQGRNDTTQEQRDGAVYLIDLAGTEAHDITTSASSKETGFINKSLAALGKVISACDQEKSRAVSRL